jgi:alpha-methylacyl-CoA racemase
MSTEKQTTENKTGPLAGIRVVEFAGIGPGPFAAMLLADMGADVITIETPAKGIVGQRNPLNRGKRSVALNLKKKGDWQAAFALASRADVLIEGYRPGVMERLGFGPEQLHKANPKLVFGRMTGWGQNGPMAKMAGHDINYVALSGALALAQRPGQAPMIPPTIVGDIGGALYLAFGVVCALLECTKSGKGQVIDAAIVDSVAHMQSLVHAFRAMGIWSDEPSQNFFANTSHFYETFTCADGKHLAVGAIETPFYLELITKLDLFEELVASQHRPEEWPALKKMVAARIAEHPQSYWMEVFAGSDACAVPVLDYQAAAVHPHNQARGTFVEVDGFVQAAPAPRFSRSGTRAPAAGPVLGEHTAQVLAELQALAPAAA